MCLWPVVVYIYCLCLCPILSIYEGLNGVPLKSVISKILTKKSVISKI